MGDLTAIDVLIDPEDSMKELARSVNQRMLIARDANLCLRCHSQVQDGPGSLAIGKFDHSSFIRGRTCWSAGCHPAVHGSNINGKLHY